jgi:hypothetical protein
LFTNIRYATEIGVKKTTRRRPEVAASQLNVATLIRSPQMAPDLVNIKVPADALAKVHAIARRLGVTKTAAFIALINEGLQEARRRGIGVK